VQIALFILEKFDLADLQEMDSFGFSFEYFNINDGSFYPSDPATPYISGPNTAKIIYQLCTCPLAEIKAIPLNRQSRNILLDVILSFLPASIWNI